MNLLSREFESQDQDILNIVSVNKIRLLPIKYNFMTKYYKWAPERFGALAAESEVIDAKKNPIVIHYADKVKPWNNMHSALARNWWDVALSDHCWSIFVAEKKELVLNTIYGKNKREKRLERQLRNIERSISFKLGRIITFLPRKTKGAYFCCIDHGFLYTVELTKNKAKRLIRIN